MGSSPEIQQVLNYALTSITPVLVLIVGAYARSILRRVERIESLEQQIIKLQGEVSSLKVIKDEWVEVRMDLTKLMVQMEGAIKVQEDVTIIRRDLNSVWRAIDEIKTSLRQ